MNRQEAVKCVQDALTRLKGSQPENFAEKFLTTDLNFESLDIIDLLFEIEQSTGVNIDLGRLLGSVEERSERRFRDLKISDIIEYISENSDD